MELAQGFYNGRTSKESFHLIPFISAKYSGAGVRSRRQATDDRGIVYGSFRGSYKHLFILFFPLLPLQTMSSGVVQVFTADRNGSWNKRCCGVACLVKDNTKRSYFIRVFDIREGKTMFEQELYTGFTDNLQRPYFITFAGDVSRPSPLWVSRFRPNLLSLAGFLTRCDSLVFCAI
ncbi:hypothetical protein GOODEAATRI_010681, partial [Goodea atripinnis]